MMSFYFVCPGQATVSANEVQCSATISTVDVGWTSNLSYEDKQAIIDSLLGTLATLAVCWLIKKALDI